MKASGYWLLAIVVGAFVLRTWNVSSQCLDIDEYTELQVQHKTYAEAADAADSMPPLFPVLLKSCLAIWPDDMTGRWFSVVIGIATVWVVGVLWAPCLGQPLALATAALLAISPLHIFYSQYTRSYGLVMFWTALAIGSLMLALKSRRPLHWVLFAVCALGGLYTHYYFAIFLGVLSVSLACWADGWRWSRQWWVANLCIGVLALPLVGFVGKDLHFQKGLRESRPLDVAAFGYTYVSMMTGYSIGPAKRDLQVMNRSEALKSAGPIAAAVGAIFLSLGLAGLSYLRKRRLFTVFCLLTLVPVLVVGVLGRLADVTYNPRFVVWCLLPLLALLAAGVVQVGRSWGARSGLALLVLVSACAIQNRESVAQYQNEDAHSLAAFLQQQDAGQDAPVFVISNYMVPLVAHYLTDEWCVVEVPTVEATDAMELPTQLVPLAEQALAEQLPDGGPFWLVYTRPFHGDSDGQILDYLIANGALEKVQEFAGITLYHGDRRPVSD